MDRDEVGTKTEKRKFGQGHIAWVESIRSQPADVLPQQSPGGGDLWILATQTETPDGQVG